jgi:hypothetical protein
MSKWNKMWLNGAFWGFWTGMTVIAALWALTLIFGKP